VVHADPIITLDPGIEYQEISGWEAVGWASQDHESFPFFRDAAYDLAVDEAGLNRIRLEIRSGVENDTDWWQLLQDGVIDYATWRSHRYATVNDNADPFDLDPSGYHFSEMDSAITQILLPLKSRVEANGETFYINLNYVAFTGQIGSGLQYHHDDPEEYAEFMEATWLHLENTFGWTPHGLEILLEPDNVSQWNGTLMGQAVVAVMSRLATHGYAPHIIVPSNTHMGNAITYFDDLIAVPGALAHVTEYAYHRYGGATDANLQAIVDRAIQHGLDTSMLEWWTPSNGYPVLHKDLKLGRNSAWQQGVVAGIDDGGASMAFVHVDAADPQNPIVYLNEKTEFTRLYYRFVRSGAVRVEAITTDAGFDPLAFVNLDGGTVVVVKTTTGGGFSVEDLPPRDSGIIYTISGASGVELPDQTLAPGEDLVTAIPAAGVITIHQRVPVVSVPAPGIAPVARLAPFQPNPFSPRTAIGFELDRTAGVDLDVFDARGRHVRSLLEEVREAGAHQVEWDGTDGRGRAVPSGVYTVRLVADGGVVARRVIRVR
jgi:hypothetical protein